MSGGYVSFDSDQVIELSEPLVADESSIQVTLLVRCFQTGKKFLHSLSPTPQSTLRVSGLGSFGSLGEGGNFSATWGKVRVIDFNFYFLPLNILSIS